MRTLIDTDILSRFFRNDAKVVARFSDYVHEYGEIHISIVTFYEIMSGLLHRDAQNQMARFTNFVATNQVLPLTQAAATQAAQLYAQTRQAGTPVDDIDLLIAGIALANNMAIATHNVAHFSKIPGLIVEDWCV